MIFVTVGTHEDPFDRLLAAAAGLPCLDQEVVVQHGSGQAVSGTRSVAYLSYEEMVSHMRSANAVVCHAGVGSVLTALRCGKRPIIMPRRGDLGEHVDEHQCELAARLEEVDLATVVHSEPELHAALHAAGEHRAPRLRRPGLELALGDYIRHHVGLSDPGPFTHGAPR